MESIFLLFWPVSAAMTHFIFAKKKKKELPKEALYNICLLSFEPGLNSNIICGTKPEPVQTSTVRTGKYGLI
jgi:hypothetical protein